MKKTLSVILSLVLIFSVINLGGITAFAENETITDGDYSYRLLDDGTYELLSYEGADTDLIIPSEFRGLPVTVLGVYSCSLCGYKRGLYRRCVRYVLYRQGNLRLND